MGAGIDKLTDIRIKRFIAKAKPGQKLADGGGLYLRITPKETPVFRIDYRIHDATRGCVVGRTYSIGVYPQVTLAMARERRAEVKANLELGRDPMVARKVQQAQAAVATGTTFGDVANQWLAQRKREWSDIHYEKSSRALERDVLPHIGKLPIGELTSPMISDVIQRVSIRKSAKSPEGAIETASRIRQHIEGILSYAKATGTPFLENPATAASAILPKRKAITRRAALDDFSELGKVLRDVDRANASAAVKVAHKLVAYAPGARIGNVARARWNQFSLDTDQGAAWEIPRAEMKVRGGRDFPHKIVLGPTIAATLRQWKLVSGGQGDDFLFPSPAKPEQPITRESIEKLYRVTLKAEISGRHSVHGWRSSFATLAKEGGFDKVAVELALDHVGDREIIRTYDRGARLPDRQRLAYWWDCQLSNAERGPAGDNVLAFAQKAG